jgi:hypothetical protein
MSVGNENNQKKALCSGLKSFKKRINNIWFTQS